MATLSFSNLNKPSNKRWKLVGDIMVFGLIPELGIIATIESLSPEQKFWIAFAVAQVSLISKLITKFTSEEVTQAE